MKEKKVLLLTCPLELSKYILPRAYPPLGPAYIAANLLQYGCEVKIYDPIIEGIEEKEEIRENIFRIGAPENEIVRIIEKFGPDIVGISTQFVGNANQAHRLADLIKGISKEIITVVGGYYPFALPGECLADKNIDYMVMGEGENTFVHLLEHLFGGKGFPVNVYTQKNVSSAIPYIFPVETNLDKLPIPARHLLPMPKYNTFLKEMEP